MINQENLVNPKSKKMFRGGRIMSGLTVLFLLSDSIIHILNIAPVVEAMIKLGYPTDLAPIIGIIELICLILYVIPRTSILGAILLTGYLGGAVSTNLRAGTPLFSNILFPVYIGIFIWGGLYLRDENIRALIPFKKR